MFFAHIDNFREPSFLYVTSKGIAACNSEPRQGTITTSRALHRRRDDGPKWMADENRAGTERLPVEKEKTEEVKGDEITDDGLSGQKRKTEKDDSIDAANNGPAAKTRKIDE